MAVNSITFFASGLPKGQPRPRAFAFHGRARVFDPGTAEGWKAQVAQAAAPLISDPLSVPVAVEVTFYLPRPKSHYRGNGELKPTAPAYCTTKPDADNLAKAVLDALTTLGAWEDDSQVVRLLAVKRYANGQTGASVAITPAVSENQTANEGTLL